MGYGKVDAAHAGPCGRDRTAGCDSVRIGFSNSMAQAKIVAWNRADGPFSGPVPPGLHRQGL